ncbi:J domain-containing protein [Pigmentibacter ruber]|uniref:J domain-containing protein n=1 Tax=Pigmentibacter ruber TaxID=2683196 RepID=UPI00131DFF94|nr:J domain-containing protein [Pigmentibacter ruber]
MDIDFIDDDSFQSKKQEAELKQQKKLAKQERLARKKDLILNIQNLLKTNSSNDSYNFENCLLNAEKYKCGSKDWALAILNLQAPVNLKEIKEKYILLAQILHPDKNSQNNPEAMKYLNEAWQILKKNI